MMRRRNVVSRVLCRSLFSLPNVPYAKTGLPPTITAEAMDYHLNKHHQTYVTNANKLVVGTPFESAPLEQVIKDTSTQKNYAVLFNNVAQIYNHSFFWSCMTAEKTAPSPELEAALKLHFGGVEQFKDKFSQSAMAVFGSGWTWLIANDGQLEITNTFNAGTPLTQAGLTPLLVLDVWEHAYYVDHRNRRGDFIKGYWNVVDWNALSGRWKGIKRSAFD